VAIENRHGWTFDAWMNDDGIPQIHVLKLVRYHDGRPDQEVWQSAPLTLDTGTFEYQDDRGPEHGYHREVMISDRKYKRLEKLIDELGAEGRY